MKTLATADGNRARILDVVEAAHIPALSAVLAYTAMLPILAGTLGTWLLSPTFALLALDATLLWSGAILLFLAGVRRGLSFRTEGGATAAQILTMLWLFALGLGSLLALILLFPRVSLVLALFGYGSLAVLDPLAARRGEAPLFFARLRPLQMLIPILSLGSLLF